MTLTKHFSIVTVCLIGLLAACSSAPEQATATTPQISPTATVTRPVIITDPTLAPDACPTTPSNFLPGIFPFPFPSGALALDQGTGGWDGVHSLDITVVVVCVPSTTPKAIYQYYMVTMPQQGWVTSTTFPTTFPYNDPNVQPVCGDSYCWEKPGNNSATWAVSLEDVRTIGGSTARFVIRFASYT